MEKFDNTAVLKIIDAFPSFGTFKGIKPIGNGHINDTFVARYENDEGKTVKYLLQKINTYVFKNPAELMENIIGVTEHLKKKIAQYGGDTERETLTVYKTKDNKSFYLADDGSAWRLYNFVDNTYSLDTINSPEEFYDAAYSFGNFRRLLSDYPIEKLHDTIPNFHNTVSRFADFKKAVSDDLKNRAKDISEDINFVLERESDCGVLVSLVNKGKLPLSVTHNDTKLNNILFDNVTKKGICVVDLDTVMPGLSLYDFGDSIRFGANTAAEDEKDLSKVKLDLTLYKAYVEGYLKAAGSDILENEIKYLSFSAKLLTLECGMRFLGDYLNGDTYFKTDYPEHNLVRARCQLKLVKEIEENLDKMDEIVKNAVLNNK